LQEAVVVLEMLKGVRRNTEYSGDAEVVEVGRHS
jgi:hypothetical protein